MAENEDTLDSFLNNPVEQNQPQQKNTEKENKIVNLEDEFAKLLNDFINQDNKPASSPTAPQPSAPAQSSAPNEGLDSFLTNTVNPPQSSNPPAAGGLDSFISPAAPAPSPNANAASKVNGGKKESLDSMLSNTVVAAPTTVDENKSALKQEEQELSRAITNFQDGIYALADKKNFNVPSTDYNESMLLPNYKPSVGKKIAEYLLACWDVLNKYDPKNMKRLSKDATDEEYLSFAESLNDTDMQLAIISYVEILINIEICEVSYEQKKEIIQKNRIKKELYDEYMELQERKKMFIAKLKEKNFPIDVNKLINNYFRAAQKDAKGSYEALTKNPAMFSPIEFEKLHPRFFGLIKVTPEDGIKANQKIGNFIKKLKV